MKLGWLGEPLGQGRCLYEAIEAWLAAAGCLLSHQGSGTSSGLGAEPDQSEHRITTLLTNQKPGN